MGDEGKKPGTGRVFDESVTLSAVADLKTGAILTELEARLAPLFQEMRDDRLYRVAYGDNIGFPGRPEHASEEAIRLLARYHYERRRREEEEQRNEKREAQTRRTNWIIALVAAAVGAFVGVLLTLLTSPLQGP